MPPPSSIASTPVRVAVVEDDAACRTALAHALQGASDMRLAWTAASRTEAMAALAQDDAAPLDVLLLDLGLPDGSGLDVLVGGMCETDYSGYPDCRDDTLKALQVAVSLGMGQRFTFDTPLMWLDKAETWELARSLGGQALVDLIVNDSHTCYHGVRDTLHAWGYGCGTCPACALRRSGYERWKGGSASV